MRTVRTTTRDRALAHGSPPLHLLILELASGTAARLIQHRGHGDAR